jgi:hypothetical protein
LAAAQRAWFVVARCLPIETDVEDATFVPVCIQWRTATP